MLNFSGKTRFLVALSIAVTLCSCQSEMNGDPVPDSGSSDSSAPDDVADAFGADATSKDVASPDLNEAPDGGGGPDAGDGIGCAPPDDAESAASYDDLRDRAGESGHEVFVAAERLCGMFAWSSEDPNGLGDDGGIVIASANDGWWVRQWDYGPDGPIELDWFELEDGDDIDGLVNDLAATHSPSLYVRMPSTPMTLRATQWDFTCAGHAIENLRILESSADVTVVFPEATGARILTGLRQGSCTSQPMSDLVIGTDIDKDDRDAYNLTLDGSSIAPVEGSPNGKGGTLLMARDVVGSLDIEIRANFSNVRSRALNILGNNIGTVTVSGRITNAGIFFSQNDTVVFDDTLYYADPLAKNWGWTGEIEDGVAISNYSTHGSHDAGIGFTYVRNIYGAIEMEYGKPTWALHFHNGNVGTESEPFTLISRELGFLPTGEWLGDAGLVQQWGKTDSMQIAGDTDGDYFLKFVSHPPASGDYRTSGPPPTGEGSYNWNVAFEATANGCAGQPAGSYPEWNNDNITVTLVNFRSSFFGNRVGCVDPMGTSDNNTYRGDGVNPAMTVGTLFLGTNNTVRDGQFSRIVTHAGPVQYAPQDTTAPCHGNTIRDAETRDIVIQETCVDTTIDNVTGDASQEVQAEESFLCDGMGTIPAGTYRFDSSALGAVALADGKYRICGN